MRAFALLPFFAAAALARTNVGTPDSWDLWGDKGDNCTPGESLEAKYGLNHKFGACQPIPGDYESYHFTDDGHIKIGLFEDKDCSGSDIGYDLKGCIRPGTLKKAKYFKVCCELDCPSWALDWV